MRRTNDNRAIIASLGLDQEHIHSYEKYLKKLQKSYRFLFTGQNQINLYQYIRRFLRSWLLNACYNLKIENIIKNVKSVYQNQLNTLEKTRSYQDVQSRLEDDEWVEAYLDLAEIHYWLDAHEGILYSILILLAVTAYRPNAHYDIIQIGTFFETSMKQPAQKWWSLATRFLYAPSSMYPVEAQKQGLKDLAKFLNEGKFKCTSVLAAHVQELEAIIWWQLGKVYQNSQEQQALYWYEKALSRLPEQEDLQEVILNIYWMRADNAYHQEQYKKSISFLQEALTIKYNFADAYYSLGNVYYKLKDYQSAITNYQYAIECDTSHCNAYVNLGNTHFKRGEYGRAIEEYNQSILLEDKDAILYYNRANAYEALHNYAAALNDFEDAIALDATLACAYLNRGHVYALQQKYDEAISQYKQAFELDPRDIQTAWTLRWTSFTSTSIAEKGIQALEEIAALDTKHYVSCLCRAIILWLGQREPKAAY